MRFPGNDPGIRFGIAPRTAAPLQAPALVTLRCHYMAKKYKNHGKKVARSLVFPFFQCRNIFFSSARGKRAVAARGAPCPQGRADAPYVRNNLRTQRAVPRETRQTRPRRGRKQGKAVCRRWGQSRPRRRRERGNAACRRERESRAGRREQKKIFTKSLQFPDNSLIGYDIITGKRRRQDDQYPCGRGRRRTQ